MSAQSRDIILYHYDFSPYARRIGWYLNFRQIPYSQCLVPPTMPRPEVALIGTQYRRIPILSIGRDIYTDTRLLISKLEILFPSPKYPSISSSLSKPEHQAIESLLERWAVEPAGLFERAAQLIPVEAPLLKDEKFLRDREEYTGRSWKRESVEKGRPEALVEMRGGFEWLENGLLRDGRQWILGTESVTLADIEAVWTLHWITKLPGALPGDIFSPQLFPRVYAWISRFHAATKSASLKAGKPKTLPSEEAMKQIGRSEFAEPEATVDEHDPTGLRKGQEVEVWPTDTGFSRKDRGGLVGLNGQEIVIQGRTKEGEGVRIHFPRHGFRVRGVGNM